VLDGDLERLVEAELRRRASGDGPAASPDGAAGG
jgi:hypothetical protein